MATAVERAQSKQKIAVEQLMKLQQRRDQALEGVIRAQKKLVEAIKLVARGQKRLDKLREEEKAAKLLRKQAKDACKKETPDIAAVLGV